MLGYCVPGGGQNHKEFKQPHVVPPPPSVPSTLNLLSPHRFLNPQTLPRTRLGSKSMSLVRKKSFRLCAKRPSLLASRYGSRMMSIILSIATSRSLSVRSSPSYCHLHKARHAGSCDLIL